MKKKAALGVAVFVGLLLAAIYAMHADAQPRIALGSTFNKSDLTYGEVGYEWRGWEATVGQIGEGKTDYGGQGVADVYSLSYLVRPPWCIGGFCNYLRIGAAHVDESPLVGTTNYRLGIGLEHRHVMLEYFHYSSAGIWENNGGIDGVVLRLKFPGGGP